MRHEQFQDNLSSYVEGALDPALTTAMDHHTRECPSCAAELAEMRRVYSLLASPMMDVEPPPMFHDNVMRRVRLAQREREKSPHGVFARLGWGWIAASGVTVVALLMAVVLSVGPLGDGLTAGFGLRRAPEVSVDRPALGFFVTLPDATATPGQEFPVTVQLMGPEGGEWRLMVEAEAGLTLASPGATAPGGEREIWRGPMMAGQRVKLRLYPDGPGQVGTLALRLERANGFTAARETLFVPAAGPNETGNANPIAAPNTLRIALMDFARVAGRPVSAPTEALDAAVPGADAAMSLESLAGRAGLTVHPAGSGFALIR